MGISTKAKVLAFKERAAQFVRVNINGIGSPMASRAQYLKPVEASLVDAVTHTLRTYYKTRSAGELG